MSDSEIAVRNLSRQYLDAERGPVHVLKDVSFEVPAGQFAALTGASGSGKSTLMHILAGLDAQYTGSVEVAGQRLEGQQEISMARYRNQHVGIVFQAFHLVPELSALENVLIPAFFAKQQVQQAEQKALQALDRVGLEKKSHRFPSQLSGGEKQRVAIARALFMEPKVLLCDEPTGNLDAETAEVVLGIFNKLNEQGMTLLVVTHEKRVCEVAQRVLHLSQGVLQ